MQVDTRAFVFYRSYAIYTLNMRDSFRGYIELWINKCFSSAEAARVKPTARPT